MSSIVLKLLRKNVNSNRLPQNIEESVKFIEKTNNEPPTIIDPQDVDPNFPRSLCDYSTLKYIDLKKLIDPDKNLYYYNSCICKYKDCYRLFYRCGRNPKTVNDRIATCLLTTNLEVIPDTNKYVDVFSDWKESAKSGNSDKPREILYTYYDEDENYIQKSYIYNKNEHVEDPRVIEFNKSWFMTYTDGLATAVAKLDLDTCDTIYSHFLKSPPVEYTPANSDGREKNWILCSDKDKLYVLYSEVPRTFIEYKDTGTSLVNVGIFRTNYKVDWPFGDIRGGCSPIEFGTSTLIWFFHSVKSLNTTIRDKTKVYIIGAYITQNKYPFKITQMLKQPLLMGIPSPVSRKLLIQDNVVYPCGAITLDSQTFLISMGINDYKIAHLEVKKDMLRWEKFNYTYKRLTHLDILTTIS
jgi:predicted GH43/DUF377 family glycosyl hydrolase